MAYFLGKGIDANLDDLFPRGGNKAECLQRCREQLSLDPGFDYQGCIDGCGGMRIQSAEVGIGPESPFEPVTEPLATPSGKKEVIRDGTVVPKDLYDPDAPAEEVGEADWLENLMSTMFGKEFETVRGIGGRSREAVFDTLARQGLLGTGAAKGVAEDVAWQTERGITDLMRWGEQWKYGQEQDVMNQIMQYFFGMGQMWR